MVLCICNPYYKKKLITYDKSIIDNMIYYRYHSLLPQYKIIALIFVHDK